MKVWKTTYIALVAVLVLGGGMTLTVLAENEEKEEAAEEQAVGLDALPEAVKATLSKVAPTAKPIEATLEEEDDVDVYEVEVKCEDGKIQDIVIAASGQLVEIEEEVEEAALPAAVKKTLSQVLPQGKTLEAEMKSVILFEVKKEVDGAVYEMIIDANGKPWSISVDHEDEDEGDEPDAADDDEDEDEDDD